MSFRAGSVSATGRIVAETDNAHCLVIEFHARSKNANSVYVGGSDVSTSNGREIPAGESFVVNLALPDERQHAGRVLLSSFYAVTTGGDLVDWSAVIRNPAT